MLQTAWEVIKPYAIALLSTVGSGTIITAIAMGIIRTFLRKFTTKYDIDRMADKVAHKLVGNTINIDVTAIAEKRLNEIDDMLTAKLSAIEKETSSYKQLLARIGSSVSRFKALTDEEREALIAAVQELDKNYKPPKVAEVSTIKLMPIATEKKIEAEDKHIKLG